MINQSKCLWHCCLSSSRDYQNKFCSRNCKNKYYVDRRRKNLKIKAVEYKGSKCQNCDYNKCIAALDFHHIDPTQKEFRISNGDTKSWDAVMKELDKCVLLCSNCHRETHFAIDRQLESENMGSLG